MASDRSIYPYQASLDMGNIAYYPIDPKNISASTVSFLLVSFERFDQY